MITTNRRVPMIAGAAALLLVLVWYFTLWSPQMKSISKAHKARAAAEAQVSQLQGQVTQLQGLVKNIPADNARFAQLATALPDNPQLDQALHLLHDAASQNGVLISNLAPSTPQTGASAGGVSGGPAVSLTMTIQGSVGQLKAFLAALETLPRTVVVDKISLSGGSPASASVNARIFYAGQPTP